MHAHRRASPSRWCGQVGACRGRVAGAMGKAVPWWRLKNVGARVTHRRSSEKAGVSPIVYLFCFVHITEYFTNIMLVLNEYFRSRPVEQALGNKRPDRRVWHENTWLAWKATLMDRQNQRVLGATLGKKRPRQCDYKVSSKGNLWNSLA